MEKTLRERLDEYMRRPGYEPQDRSAIARGMGVNPAERQELRTLLVQLEQENRLLRLRGRKLAPAPAPQSSYSGTVRVLPRGKRMFLPDAQALAALAPAADPTEHETALMIPIEKGHSMGAIEGDEVRVVVRHTAPLTYRRRKKGLRPNPPGVQLLTARVEEVLHRRHELWVGTYAMHGRHPEVRGDGRSSPLRIRLTEPPPPEALVGMLVTVQPVVTREDEARGRIAEVLGWPDDPGVDMEALMCRYALRTEFPAAALAETRLLPPAPLPADMEGREDWSARCVVTIDPPTARDFDDAICLTRTGNGWELAVHIADVSHYVRPGSALDAEAQLRGNSTYLPDRVLPMLPPRLCDDLCSLVEGAARLTMLCHMRLNAEGVVEHARVARAVICSRRRLTYPDVQALLQEERSTGDAEVDAMLRDASQLAKLMRQRRMAQGALELDMPELRAITDEQGRVVGFAREESDDSHRLIEECMLAANEQVARLLRERRLPAIYRVHEEPAPSKWAHLAQTLREYGVAAAMVPSRRDLVHIMEQLKDHPDAPRLRLLLLRAMQKAHYTTRPLGHFGLAKADYCHFTSPIRRYADLVVHRGIARLAAQNSAGQLPAAGHIEQLAKHLSDTERCSAAAEAEAMRLKVLQYLETQAAADHPQPHRAIVTGLWAHGIALELEELMQRAYIPASELSRDWFFAGYEWRGPSGARLHEGSGTSVVPVEVDWDFQSVTCRLHTE